MVASLRDNTLGVTAHSVRERGTIANSIGGVFVQAFAAILVIKCSHWLLFKLGGVESLSLPLVCKGSNQCTCSCSSFWWSPTSGPSGIATLSRREEARLFVIPAMTSLSCRYSEYALAITRAGC